MSRRIRKLRVMHRYDQSAKVYEAQYRDEQEAKIKTAMDNVTIDKDSRVLDAGCGTGLLFGHVAKKIKALIGTDISRRIIKEAKGKAKKYENIDVILADVDSLPFPHQTFDAVFSITTIQNTPNATFTIKEIKRVSKPNSPIVITGLRKVFTKEQFSEMLRQTDLRVVVQKSDEQLKDHICICTQMRR